MLLSTTVEATPVCADGNCLVGAIDKQSDILASNVPDDARLIALKNAVHFVADVHQPLHTGYLDDRGATATRFKPSGEAATCTRRWIPG